MFALKHMQLKAESSEPIPRLIEVKISLDINGSQTKPATHWDALDAHDSHQCVFLARYYQHVGILSACAHCGNC